MTPTVGRIIHVPAPATLKCLAAIITDVRDEVICVTIFAPHGSMHDTTHRADYILEERQWHDPRECPNTPKTDERCISDPSHQYHSHD